MEFLNVLPSIKAKLPEEIRIGRSVLPGNSLWPWWGMLNWPLQRFYISDLQCLGIKRSLSINHLVNLNWILGTPQDEAEKVEILRIKLRFSSLHHVWISLGSVSGDALHPDHWPTSTSAERLRASGWYRGRLGSQDGTLLEISVNRYYLLLTTHTYMGYLGVRTLSSNHVLKFSKDIAGCRCDFSVFSPNPKLVKDVVLGLMDKQRRLTVPPNAKILKAPWWGQIRTCCNGTVLFFSPPYRGYSVFSHQNNALTHSENRRSQQIVF